jgi:hypothetical protein
VSNAPVCAVPRRVTPIAFGRLSASRQKSACFRESNNWRGACSRSLATKPFLRWMEPYMDHRRIGSHIFVALVAVAVFATTSTIPSTALASVNKPAKPSVASSSALRSRGDKINTNHSPWPSAVVWGNAVVWAQWDHVP